MLPAHEAPGSHGRLYLPLPLLTKEGKRLTACHARPPTRAFTPPYKGGEKKKPSLCQGRKGPDARATAAEWAEPPPLCKGREGGVEGLGLRTEGGGTLLPAHGTPGGVADSTSPCPSLQRRGKEKASPLEVEGRRGRRPRSANGRKGNVAARPWSPGGL